MFAKVPDGLFGLLALALRFRSPSLRHHANNPVAQP